MGILPAGRKLSDPLTALISIRCGISKGWPWANATGASLGMQKGNGRYTTLQGKTFGVKY